MPTANTSIYKLTVTGLPADQFSVVEFRGVETVSDGYKYFVTAISQDTDLGYDELIGVQSTFDIAIHDDTITHHGIITEIDEEPYIGSSAQYKITIEPKLSLLRYTSQSRIFQEKNVQEIIQEVLEGAGLTSSDFAFELQGTYAANEFVVQYNETDLNFIKRLMEYNGIFYFFDHEGQSEVMKICDANSSFAQMQVESQLRYQPNADMIEPELNTVRSMNRQRKMITGKVTLKDYNYTQPDTNIFGTASGTGVGEFYQFADSIPTTSEANRLATLRQEMLACTKDLLRIRSSCHQVKTGYQCSINDDGNFGFASDYIVLRVEHSGSQESAVVGGGRETTYNNIFHVIDASVPFRPEIKSRKPKVEGLMSVKVDGPQDDYAYLDDAGRYKVKLPYDLSDASDGTASLPVRMSQPYSGNNYGVHFPVHMGCDLVVGFENGDIDKPIAIGTSPNPSQASPVNSNNKTESIIKTASGHQLRFDDLEDSTKVDLITTGGHTVELNDNQDTQQILVKSIAANQILIDDKNEIITINTTENKSTITMDNKNRFTSIETETGHLIKMDDENEMLAVQTAAGHMLQISDADNLITLKDADGNHVIQIDTTGTISVTTTGDLELKADGALNIQGNEVNITGDSGVNISSGQGAVAIEGMDVSAKSSTGDLVLEGTMNATMKGNMGVAISGLKVECTADTTAKFAGLQTTVEGSAMTEVKGGMVMIN